jgi:hypothetical protein
LMAPGWSTPLDRLSTFLLKKGIAKNNMVVSGSSVNHNGVSV